MRMPNSLTQLVLRDDVRGAQARRSMLGALPGWHVRPGLRPMRRVPAASTDKAQSHPRLIFPAHLSLRAMANSSSQRFLPKCQCIAPVASSGDVKASGRCHPWCGT
jgi:hypothetical protein